MAEEDRTEQPAAGTARDLSRMPAKTVVSIAAPTTGRLVLIKSDDSDLGNGHMPRDGEA
jgi:hypothetical protein